MEFEWDDEKNRTNKLKHHIAFEDAIEVFDDPYELTEPAKTVEGEIREQTIGIVSQLAVLLVVHTKRKSIVGAEVRRIISARPASEKERERYERRKS